MTLAEEELEEDFRSIIITEPIRGKYIQLAEARHFAINPDTERTQGGTYLDVRVFDERGEEWRRWMDLEKNIVFLPTEENMQIYNSLLRMIAEEKVLALMIRNQMERFTDPITPENVAGHFTEETPEEMRKGPNE